MPSERALDIATQSNVFWSIYFGLLLLTAAGVWATFVKAGQRGWTCLVPCYNLVVLLKIVRIHPLWAILFLIPLVNILFASFAAMRLAHQFGKGIGFGLGLIFLPCIYYPALGFGSAKYQTKATTEIDVLPSGKAAADSVYYRKAG